MNRVISCVVAVFVAASSLASQALGQTITFSPNNISLPNNTPSGTIVGTATVPPGFGPPTIRSCGQNPCPLGFSGSASPYNVVTTTPTLTNTTNASLVAAASPAQTGGTVACDVGSPAVVPASAQVAGMTHCFFHLDFSNNFTGGNGVNPQQLSTWLGNCNGQQTIGSTNQRFVLTQLFSDGVGGVYTGVHLGPAPCNRATITTDQGFTVLDLPFPAKSDYLNNHLYEQRFEWPSSYWGGAGSSITQFFYLSIEFRVPFEAMQNRTPVGGYYNAFYIPGTNAPEIDFFELDDRVGPTSRSYGMQGVQWNTDQTGNGNCSTPCVFTDTTVYHNYEVILTWNGDSSQAGSVASSCGWVDGHISRNPCWKYENSNFPWVIYGAETQANTVMQYWDSPHACFCQNTTQCPDPPSRFRESGICLFDGDNWHRYIKSMTVFACPGALTTPCSGPLVNAEVLRDEAVKHAESQPWGTSLRVDWAKTKIVLRDMWGHLLVDVAEAKESL